MSGVGSVRPEIQGFRSYTLAVEEGPPLVAKLDFNESPYDVPAELKERVFARLREQRWSVYPEFGSPRLVEAIARHVSRGPEEIVVGNGSGEVILAAVSVLAGCGGTLVLATPSFSLYEQMAAIVGARVVRVPRIGTDFAADVEALIATCRREGRAVPLLCSPNNPTGGVLPLSAVRRLSEAAGVVLLDQAYVDFAEPDDDALPLLSELPNLVVFRTLSKAFSAAGFRIGYAAARAELAAEIRKAVLPFSVDLAAEALALAVLAEPGTARRTVETIRAERDRLAASLDALGIEVASSGSNFLFCRIPRARDVRRALRERGILVRDMTSAAEDRLRITVGTRAENDLLLAALKEIS